MGVIPKPALSPAGRGISGEILCAPPSERLAVVVGAPSMRDPYTIRVRVPRGVKLIPHRHPGNRVYTVISGVFYIGLGDQFNPEKLEAYPPGSVVVLPGNTSHFHWAKSSEYVTQVTAIGPLGLEYKVVVIGRSIRSPPSNPPKKSIAVSVMRLVISTSVGAGS